MVSKNVQLVRQIAASCLLGGVLLVMPPGTRTLLAQEPRPLDSPFAVERLCQRLEGPAGTLVPPGDPVERGRQRQRSLEERDQLLATFYQVTLRAEEFHFDDYEPLSQRLPLNLTSGLTPFGGRVKLVPPGEKVSLWLRMADASWLVNAHSSRNLQLVVEFLLDASQGDQRICGIEREITARPIRLLHIIPQHLRWQDEGGRLVAAWSGENEERKREQLESLLQQARVKAQVARVQDGSPDGGTRQLAVDGILEPLLLPCLQERILQTGRPVEGSLVIELECRPDHRLDRCRQAFQQNLVEDLLLLQCVERRLREAPVTLPLEVGGRRLTFPIFFQSVKLE